MATTTEKEIKKTERYIKSLSPVKQYAAIKLNELKTPKQTAKDISKKNNSSLSNAMAWVTMVVNDAKAKKIVFGLKKEKVVTTKKECKPTYSHNPETDIAKVKVQNRLIEEVIASNITGGLVLTLSWIKCIVEKQLNKKIKGLKYLSCEMDLNTFIKLINEINVNNLDFMLEPLRCEIGRIIRTSQKDTFAHLFLDYCGHLETFKDEVEYAIKNNIVQKNGVIWMTFSSRSGKGKKGFNTKDELEKLIKKAGGKDYKIEFIDNYRDTTPMCTAIIRRIK